MKLGNLQLKHFIISILAVIVLIGGGLTAYYGNRDVGITETEIPPETIDYLKKLAKSLSDLNFDFKKGKKTDWTNNDDDKQALDRGLEKEENEHFIVYFHGPDREKAKFTINKATEAIGLMKDTFGRYPYPEDTNKRKLPLYVCRDGEEYNRLSGSDMSRSRACALIWFYTDGSTLCSGLYFAPNTYKPGQDSAAKTIAHELSHFVYFDKLKADHRYEVPPWFTEGIAEYASKGTDFLPSVKQALRDGNLIPITELSTGDKRFLVAPIVYGEGQTAFLAVEDRYSKNDVKELVDASYQYDMDGSFKEAIQKNLVAFEQEWLVYLRFKFTR
jgi:hypothetical protein